MVVIAVGCAAACLLLLLLVVTGARRRVEQRAGDQVDRGRVIAASPREEDRIRPIVDPTGERVWLEDVDTCWHEIVAWSLPVRGADSRIRVDDRGADSA
jgi:hypothetical protein